MLVCDFSDDSVQVRYITHIRLAVVYGRAEIFFCARRDGVEIGRRLGKAIQGINCVWSVASEPKKFVEHKLRCHVEFL